MDEELQYLVEHGMIDLSQIRQDIEVEKGKRYLENHPFRIWYGARDYWYSYLPDNRKGRTQIKRKSKTDLEKLIIDYWKEADRNPTFDDLFDEWNDRRLQLGQIRESSFIRYRQVYHRHYDADMGKKRIKSVKPLEIVDFLETELANKQLSAKAFGGLKDVTKGILKTAKRKELIDYSISEAFECLDVSKNDYYRKHKEDTELVFDEDETKAMTDLLISNLDMKNAGLLLLFVSGMRVGELSALKHEDLNPFECTVTVSKTETRCLLDGKMSTTVELKPKTENGYREIVIPQQYRWLLTRLWKVSEDSEWVFLNDKGTRCTTNQFRKRLKQNCIKAEVILKSPHKIRATYDTILLDSKLDSKLVIDQMGHSNITVSENSYHRNRKHISKKQEIISGIHEFSLGQSKASNT